MEDEETWGQLVSVTDLDSEPVLLSKAKFTIGRAGDCDISFGDNKLVSGHHCHLERDNDGKVWLWDTSTNGTLINLESKVSKGRRKELFHGDEFHVVYKKNDAEQNVGFMYQSKEELEKEQELEDTQEYSGDTMEATLADDDVNFIDEDVEASHEKQTDDKEKEKTKVHTTKKRPAETPPQTEPVKKKKIEEKKKTDSEEKLGQNKTDEGKKKEIDQSDKEEKVKKETDSCKEIKSSGTINVGEKRDEIEEALVCIICQEIMHDSVSLQPCMHTFCSGCYSDWMKRSSECPSCRLKVDRINKNHIVNNLIEAYLKEHPDKKRSEEDIKELEAKNTITRDMLYPESKKDQEYDPDYSSESYSEDSDDEPANPPLLNPVTQPPAYQAHFPLFGGAFQPARFVCRQCPNFVDPNATTGLTAVVGTVVNTVRTALGMTGTSTETTNENQAGPSTDNPDQDTLPSTSTEQESFEERKKKDDEKMEIVPPQYVCIPNQNHVLCQCCMQPMPDRRYEYTNNPHRFPPQQCALCYRSFCHAYWGCKKAECSGCIGKFKDLQFGRKCLQNLILDNPYESEIFENYLEENKITLNEMRETCMQNLDASKYTCRDQGRIRITSEINVCYGCGLRNFKDLAYAYRAGIDKKDLPDDAKNRPDCYWGKNCRTQKNKPHHARNFSHICEQTRTS